MNKTTGVRARKKEMGVEGVGPMIILPMIIMLFLTIEISILYSPAFDFSFLPRDLTLALGALLLVIGVPLWLWSVVTFFQAYQKDRLATRGPYAIMPNPVYSSWIVFIVPAIALLLNFWLVLATSIVMYLCQRRFIHKEDEHMRKKFGKQYEEYRKKVLIRWL
jgi:protein-S-isoprenylcysteine O-methyltransferase Ste14